LRHGDTREAGFTLIEVLAALAILGASLFVLLDNHYRALQLHDGTRESVQWDRLLGFALGVAEADVQAGNLEGSGEFGERYPGCTYSFNANRVEEIEGVLLFLVNVTVSREGESESRDMLVYNLGGAAVSDAGGRGAR